MLVTAGSLLEENRDTQSPFQQVKPFEVDPIALYHTRTGRAIPQSGDGYSENAVGPWLDDDTVTLVSGIASQIIPSNTDAEDVPLDQYTHVFVTFRAHINERDARISDFKLSGPLTNAGREKFVKQWGEHYFE